jgi:long-chain acyl-CoA synthetase
VAHATQEAPQPAADAAPRTIAALWRDAVSAGRPEPAYLVERPDGWAEVSWHDAGQAVDELANGLLALGVRKGDAFAILARTTLEWALFDFALGSIGAIAAPIYPNSSAADCTYIVEHSDSVGVLAEDDEQLEKVSDVQLAHRLTFADLDDLRARGREYAVGDSQALAEATAAIGEDDLFTFIYTSGTTGPPKGCMIRHRNYYAMASCVEELEKLVEPGDVMLLWLPLAHNFGRLMHLVGPYTGLTIAFTPDPLRLAEVMPQVKPTIFPSVPRVYEKVHTAVAAKLDEATGVKRRLVDWALRIGRRVSALRQEQRPIPPLLAAQHRLADRLVYSKIKERFGGRLRTAISGSAPLAKEIMEFFHAVDILILEGYGLTECTSAATVNRPDRYRFGTVGLALPNVELAIADDGEVLIRSPTIFAGYYEDEQATREVLRDDGWLRSGDVGALDHDGFLTINDRKKDIIVTAGGKNVAPQNLENDLKSSKYVSQALVVGDRRPYVIALITLDEDEVRKWSREHLGREVKSPARHPRVVELVGQVIDQVNQDRSRFEQIKRFAILPRDFSLDEDEITPTLKLKRRVCEEHFAAEIDELYADG